MKHMILAASVAMIGGFFMTTGEERDSKPEAKTIQPTERTTGALYYPDSVIEDASEARKKIGYIRN